MGRSGGWLRKFGVCILLGLAIAGAYANALDNDFVFDDFPLVVQNDAIPRAAADLSLIFSPGALGYRPFRTVSYVLDYRLSGLQERQFEAWIFHFSNLVYHWITACLVFFVALRLTNLLPADHTRQEGGRKDFNWLPAVFTALIWALHPVQTEAVTYISGRRDILTTLFFLCGFLAFLSWHEKRTLAGRLLCLGVLLVSYWLGVMSKEMGVTLPLVMFAYDVFREAPVSKVSFRSAYPVEFLKGAGRTLWQHKFLYGPMLLIGIYLVWYAALVILPTWAIPWYGGTIATNFLTVARIWTYYVFLLCAPVSLLADYTGLFPVTLSIVDPLSWLALLFLVSLGLLMLMVLRLSLLVAFGMAWVAITLLPVSHIIPYPEMMAEHYLYLPSVGFCLLVGIGMARIVENRAEQRWITLCGYVPIFVLILTAAYVAVRAPSGIIDSLQREVFSSVATLGFYLIALFLIVIGRFRATHGEVQGGWSARSLVMGVGVLSLLLTFYTVRTTIRNRDWRDALTFYTKMVEDNRLSCRARLGFGYVADQSGLARMAISHYARAIELCPGDPRLYTNMGAAYQKMKMLGPAREAYEESVRLQPHSSQVWNNLGFLYIEMGEFWQALEALQKAERFSHGQDPAVYANLGIMYEIQEQFDQALTAYQKALKLSPLNEVFQDKVESMRHKTTL